jgi:hypothetical protein
MLELFVLDCLKPANLIVGIFTSHSVVLGFFDLFLIVFDLFVYVFELLFEHFRIVVHGGTANVGLVIFAMVFIFIFIFFELFLLIFFEDLSDFLDLIFEFPVSFLKILDVFLPEVVK